MKKKTRKSDRKELAAAVQAATPRHPWMLISVGVIAIAFVVLVQFSGRPRPVDPVRSIGKVYSSAAEQFEPMAISSHQTGLLEPAGVAKPLRLFGVKVGGNAREGVAVLGAAEASSRTYLAGALLENGARLTELYSDHVVLTRGEQRFTLYLPEAGKRDSSASAGDLTVGAFGPAAPELSTPSVQVSDAVRLAPSYEGEQIVGFRVYAGRKPGQMERWGLKEGDVLVSLAGQPVVDAAQVDSAIDQIEQGAEIDGEVRRGQEHVRVTLDGSTLMASATSAPPSPPPMP
jgi:type II secretion system protein C